MKIGRRVKKEMRKKMSEKDIERYGKKRGREGKENGTFPGHLLCIKNIERGSSDPILTTLFYPFQVSQMGE